MVHRRTLHLYAVFAGSAIFRERLPSREASLHWMHPHAGLVTTTAPMKGWPFSVDLTSVISCSLSPEARCLCFAISSIDGLLVSPARFILMP